MRVKRKIKNAPEKTVDEIYKHYIGIGVVLLLVGWIILSFWYTSMVDECWSDRTLNSQLAYFSHTTKILFGTSVISMILCFIQVAFWHPPSGKSQLFTIENLFGIFTTLVWFIVTYTVCVLGKEYLEDKNCSFTNNSVSGHYTFHVYYFLTLPYIYFCVKTYKAAEDVAKAPKPNVSKSRKSVPKKPQANFFNKNREMIMVFTFIVFTLSTGTTLTRTLFYGYHSLRQVFYGTFLAVLSHYLAIISRPIFMRNPVKSAMIISIVFFISASITLQYGPIPLFWYEKLAYGLAFVGMWWSAWKKQNLSLGSTKNYLEILFSSRAKLYRKTK